jgi:hypothetical protein
MVPVEPLRVKTIYVAHDTGQITLRGPKTKMVVVVHKTVSKDFDAPKLMGLSEGVKKCLTVSFV